LLVAFLPVLLILPQPDPGSALIYSVFILVLHREGLPSWYLWVGFSAIFLFVMSLLFQPIYLTLAAAIIILLVYFRSRNINRNYIFSSILFILISGFVFQLIMFLIMYLNSIIVIDLIFYLENL